MCGINGFNFRDKELILKMNKSIGHRGPDQTDFWLGDSISFGHDRLSIIDLSERGKQPMWDERRELVIVFNGEIYNFQELRKDLEKKYNFVSQSDTEVILYAYKEYGSACVKKFNGIFVFAIWDVVKRELFLARDQMGVKPLYYYYDGQRFIFSSEIKGILAHDIPRQVNKEAFNFYFQIFYVPEPLTMFSGINKLPAASYLHLRAHEKPYVEKYWQVTDFSDLTSYNDAKKGIREIFDDSIKRQLVSDRPVGVYLSGGIDSTAVLGAVNNFHQGKIKTFSVGFDIVEDKFNADFILARKTANFYNTDHQELVISAQDVWNNLDNIVWHLDEPNFNPTAAAIYLLSKEAKKKVAVVLGGDGGDELFGGYPRYYYSRLISYYQKMGPVVGGLVQLALKGSHKIELAEKIKLKYGADRVLSFLATKPKLTAEVIRSGYCDRSLLNRYFMERYFSTQISDAEKHFMNIDRQSWLVDESLLRSDKMTMAAGLEERVPILDYRLVELANRIPTSWKFKVNGRRPSEFQGKEIWIDAVQDYLPEHILHEKKRGWFTPMAKWMRSELREPISEILSEKNLNSEFFQVSGVQKMWQDHLEGKRYNLNMIWSIVIWHLWYDKFIKNR